MRKIFIFMLVSALMLCSCVSNQVRNYPYTGVPFDRVHFDGGLLSERGQVVRNVTIPFAFRKCEETGRIANFARAAGLDTSAFTGLRYDDSDVFKVMEAASYSLATRYDKDLDNYMDSLIALVGAAQEPDGYLFTIRTSGGLDKDYKAGTERWSNIADSHELYNAGHMYEAAVAHYGATGKTSFLNIAKKNADLVYDTFLAQGRRIVPGHEEIELALVRLYMATGDRRYLDLSRFLLDCRGAGGDAAIYSQNHKKVTDQYEADGHAVRAMYLYTAMTDIAALCGDEAYKTAIDSLWGDVTGRKMHLTGGLGSYLASERLGEPFYLPDEETHCESCAAVGSCLWNYRMFCLTGGSRYFDIFERTLYNNVLHGISDDGTRFFYANVLRCSPYTFEWQRDWLKKKPSSGLRRAYRLQWFNTSCCPTNLARFIISLPGYAYATGPDGIYVNLFESSHSAFETQDGEKVELVCETGYPADGLVRLRFARAPRGRTALRIRIPGWATGHPVPGTLYTYSGPEAPASVIRVNGETLSYTKEKGYAVLDRKWKDGDELEVTFDMPVRFVSADPRVETLKGRIAVERGPFVYCTTLSVNDVDIRSLSISTEDHFEIQPAPGGVVALKDTKQNMSFVPYYRHAQEEITQMSVWL